jgi:hypothetical protein
MRQLKAVLGEHVVPDAGVLIDRVYECAIEVEQNTVLGGF